MQCHVCSASRGLLAAALFSLATAGSLRADDVTDWVATFSAYAAPINPLVASHDGAIVSTAVFDAVNGIERRYAPFYVTATAPRGASKRAAAVQAAYVTLLARYPAKASELDAKRTVSLAAIAHGQSKDRGIAWGQSVADAILAWRSTDGFAPAPPPYLGSNDIGKWRPTAPAFAPGLVPQFATMTPWGIQSPDQFLPPGPPALGSALYLADYEEVKAFGRFDSMVRTQEQKEIAEFWASSRPATQWNRAALQLCLTSDNELSDNARLFAMLNASIADSLIACWNAKYHYSFWRPETAIQNGAFDGVDATTGDVSWKPLQPSPPYPEYPSGLCSATSAPSTVLESFFGADTPIQLESTTVPGWVRSYPNFSASRSEVTNARVWLGIHFRFADEDGIALGQSVGNYLLANKMERIHGMGD